METPQRTTRPVDASFLSRRLPLRQWQLWMACTVLYVAVVLGIGNYSLERLPEPVVLTEVVTVEEPDGPRKRLVRFLGQGRQRLARLAKLPTELLRRKRNGKPQQYVNSYSVEPHITLEQQGLLQQLADSVHQEIPDLYHRASHVPWGGQKGAPWWSPTIKHVHHTKHAILDQLDGGFLLYSYLYIMKWPSTLHSHFPFKLCKHGCDAHVAITHTLEFREKYAPFQVSDAELDQNQEGWVYTRGLSRPSPKDPHYGRHAMVWTRPATTSVKDPVAYVRCIINTIDQAVAHSLRASHGRVGKFNVVIDGHGFDWHKMPGISTIKQTVTMLQDHYPNRLGIVFIVNVSRPAEFFINIIKQLITKEVREKIQVVGARDSAIDKLRGVVEVKHIPEWLGGKDSWTFDPHTYYPSRLQFSKAESRSFLKTMPYHAAS